MIRLVVHGKPLRGYGKWMLAEHNRAYGQRGWTSDYVYQVPDDVAAEMIKKGAEIDHDPG